MITKKIIIETYIKQDQKTSFNDIINEIINSNFDNKVIDKQKVIKFIYDFNIRWKNSKRTLEKFLCKNKTWLNTEINVMKNKYITEKNSESSNISASKISITKIKKNSTKKLISAAVKQLKKEGKTEVAKIISLACKNNCDNAPDILKKIENNNENACVFTTREALTTIIDLDLSVTKYKILRKKHKNKNNNIYPPYYKVQEEKMKCYPDSISISETCISVPLQELANHTAKRLLLNQVNAIETYREKHNLTSELSAILIFKCGFDGSTNHSIFNFKTKNSDENSEGSLISTFICPIRLFIKDNNENNTILWNNKYPNSPKFCRPLKLIQKKETKENLQIIYSEIQKEITNLSVFRDSKINVKFENVMTMLDGKAIKAIMNDSSPSVCKICIPSTPPIQMNKLNEINKKKVNKNYLDFGLSPLHLWINSLDCMLHISYRMKLKTWAVRGEINKKNNVTRKKKNSTRIKK